MEVRLSRTQTKLNEQREEAAKWANLHSRSQNQLRKPIQTPTEQNPTFKQSEVEFEGGVLRIKL